MRIGVAFLVAGLLTVPVMSGLPRPPLLDLGDETWIQRPSPEWSPLGNWTPDLGWIALDPLPADIRPTLSLGNLLPAALVHLDSASYARLRDHGVRLWPNMPVQALLDESVPMLGAPHAWSQVAPGGGPLRGQGMRIAVVDTGVDYLHPDLGGCLGPGCKVVGGIDFANGDSDPMDDHGHGTHVAAIAAGNGTFVGVAPEASVYAVKVLTAQGFGTMANIVAGISWAVDPDGDPATDDGADVINLSLGCQAGPFCNRHDPMSMAAEAASAAGVVVVAAAGNGGPIHSPGTARSAVTVGAVEKSGIYAWFSSVGPVAWGDEATFKPELVAPGVAICAAKSTLGAYPANCGPRHVRLSGTSMAAPHVAGAAALVMQAHPPWTPQQVKAELKGAASPTPIAPLDRVGAGTLDLHRISWTGPPRPHVELAPISGSAWPRTIAANGSAWSSWRLEAALTPWYAPGAWFTLANGTTRPSDGILHQLPVRFDGPLLLRLHASDGVRNATDMGFVSRVDRGQTVHVAPTLLGARNDWTNATDAFGVDRRSMRPPGNATAWVPTWLQVQVSFDGGSTWRPPRDVYLPTDSWSLGDWEFRDGRFYDVNLAAGQLDLVVRVLNGTQAQDVRGFSFDAPAARLVADVVVGLEVRVRLDAPVPPTPGLVPPEMRPDGTTPAPQPVEELLHGRPGQPARHQVEVDAVFASLVLDPGPPASPWNMTLASLTGAPLCNLLDCPFDTSGALAVPADGYPVMAFTSPYMRNTSTIQGPASQLVVGKCSDPDCSGPVKFTVVDGGVACPLGCRANWSIGRYPSIAIGGDGLPMITHTGASLNTVYYVHCGTADCSANNTYTIIDGRAPCPAGCRPDKDSDDATIFAAYDGLPLIVYGRDAEGVEQPLMVVHCRNVACTNNTYHVADGAGCQGACIPKARAAGGYQALIRPDGRPLMVYPSAGYAVGNDTIRLVSHSHAVDCIDVACSSARVNAFEGTPSGLWTDAGRPVLALRSMWPQSIHACLQAACQAAGEGHFYDGDDSRTAGTWTRMSHCLPGCLSLGAASSPTSAPGTGTVFLVQVRQTDAALEVVRCGNPTCSSGNAYAWADGRAGCVATGCDSAAIVAAVGGAEGTADGFVALYHDHTSLSWRVLRGRT